MNIVTELFWLGQIIAIFIWKCRTDGFQGKWASLAQAIGYIFASDLVYFFVMSSKGSSREVALMAVGMLSSTFMMAIPFVAQSFIKDDDPLSEKVRRVSLVTSVITSVAYLACFAVPSDGKDITDVIQSGMMTQSQNPANINMLNSLE